MLLSTECAADETGPREALAPSDGTPARPHDRVNDPVVLRVPRRHVEVAGDVVLDLLVVVARLRGQERRDVVPLPQQLARLPVDVRRLAPRRPRRVVEHHARVRETVALALLPHGQKEPHHAHTAPEADGGHVRLDVAHRVVQGKHGHDLSSRAVDVERDVLLVFAV